MKKSFLADIKQSIWSRVTLILLCVTVILRLAHSACGQTSKAKNSTNALSLSEAVDMGTEQIKVLDDDRHEAVFSLATSWIAGEGHKGYIRYRIHVFGDNVSLTYAPQYIERVYGCTYTLILYDKGEFVLRRIPIFFTKAVAASGDVTAMEANDMSQMDLSDYKSLLPAKHWQVSWACPSSTKSKD